MAGVLRARLAIWCKKSRRNDGLSCLASNYQTVTGKLPTQQQHSHLAPSASRLRGSDNSSKPAPFMTLGMRGLIGKAGSDIGHRHKESIRQIHKGGETKLVVKLPGAGLGIHYHHGKSHHLAGL